MTDITDVVERLCRIDSDDLFVDKEDTERACKWMYGRIRELEDTVAALRKQLRATTTPRVPSAILKKPYS